MRVCLDRLRVRLVRLLGGCPEPDAPLWMGDEPLAASIVQAAEDALNRGTPLRHDLHAIAQRFSDSFDPDQGTYLVEHAYRIACENEAMRMRLRQVRRNLALVPSDHRHRMVEATIRMLDVELSRLPILGVPD